MSDSRIFPTFRNENFLAYFITYALTFSSFQLSYRFNKFVNHINKKIVMKTLILLFFSASLIYAQSFNDYFNDKTMRIDYNHTGNSSSELVTLDHIYKYGIWAGSPANLIDNFNNGAYYYKVYDEASSNLIYSRGFDSYFKEYQTSNEALNGIQKVFQESAIIPSPKSKIRFALEKRDSLNNLHEIYSTVIDPTDIYISDETVDSTGVTVYKQYYSGDPHKKVDVVILGEGYTKNGKAKFEKDLKHFADLFMNQEPYRSLKNDFNIYGVYKASQDSGCDNPGAGIYKNTVLSTTYYSFGSERYILTEDNKAMRNLAANVPYDAIYIMINESRYGGGGIYNFYCTFISDNQFSDYIFLHEFGHSFSGLADEYYTSDVAYNDFYPKGVEPVEPNITRLLDKNNLKWKNLVTPGLEIPTPWEKEEYDKFDLAWQKIRRELNTKIAELQRNKAPEHDIDSLKAKYNKLDKEHSDEVDQFLHDSKYWGKTGAFEGAGYSSKGMYRPMIDCIMFSKGAKPFCTVCMESIKKVIKHYTE